MKTSKAHDQRIATMSFASVYPMYLAKVKKKGGWPILAVLILASLRHPAAIAG